MNPLEEELLAAFRALSQVDRDMLLRFAKAHALSPQERQAQILRGVTKDSRPALRLITKH